MPVAAALHLVLPLQHVPMLLEVLAKDLEGLPGQFQSGTDMVKPPCSFKALAQD